MATTSKNQAKIDLFNRAYEIGDLVTIQKDDGSKQVCTIRAAASLLCDGTPVVWVNEIVGAYAFDRVLL